MRKRLREKELCDLDCDVGEARRASWMKQLSVEKMLSLQSRHRTSEMLRVPEE